MIKFTKRWYSVIRSPHSILGLKQNATQQEAKDAYKKLVMKYHPDINKTDENAAEKFKEITEAYGILKKHFEKIENSAIPTEEGFVSKRPKYDGKVSSVLRDDKIREYINFRPLDLEVPIKEDRLGVTYKPFFTDQDATHPKLGTMAIILYSFLVSGFASSLLWNNKRRDEMVQQALFDKLMRKYEAAELDQNELHPALQLVKEDPEYQEYIKGVSEKEIYSKFQAFNKAPNIIERVSISAEDKMQKTVSFEKFKVI